MAMVFGRRESSEGFCGLAHWCRRLCPARPEEEYSDIFLQEREEQPSPRSSSDPPVPGAQAQAEPSGQHPGKPGFATSEKRVRRFHLNSLFLSCRQPVVSDEPDLDGLVNDMNTSLESLCPSSSSMQTETVPLRQSTRGQPPPSGARNAEPQASGQQKVQRSQPMHILAVRRLQEEDQQLKTSSLPAIPNPFPELGKKDGPSALQAGAGAGSASASASASASGPGPLLIPSQPPAKKDVKIFGEDGTCKVVEIPVDMKSRDLCQLLVYRTHCVDDNTWSLVEYHPHLGIERCVEDHELVAQVDSTMAGESKFLFRKNYGKYEFFKNPNNFFPDQMVTWCQQSNGGQNQMLQNFLNTSSCPEIQGFLQVKELGRKSWKKMYLCLRRSGLYCSTKGSSKEPRHLQLMADLEDCSVFTVISGKKQYHTPTEFGFCLKPNKVLQETKELRVLCAEDEQGRLCWITAFRLLKYGMSLYQNYRLPNHRKPAYLSALSGPARSVSENSLVAMDFSGQTGRVIDNPDEAESAALEEGHAWRRRSTRMSALGGNSPLAHASLNTVIHKSQHWFHGRISREESHRIIKQQGLVDGLFLVRDSQSNPKAYVLTLSHHQKIKNFQILPCEEEGQVFFSLDDGNTKFSDLIQLVDFYQLNKGVLPCKLKHHCVRVAL
ncbi:growth factor receptor-bound protein 10 isoform X2 [Pipistrellus kuhlii]|uniref:growth factor receptor-bound protein 10 isoform X2 n=1 Tax=Pipistrellus kuhlii TaxID=59472 RepID=UPI001E271762|nr:growth factor receptor-bound protein 10 isoform X2 [Pipistrellus kuhlii]